MDIIDPKQAIGAAWRAQFQDDLAPVTDNASQASGQEFSSILARMRSQATATAGAPTSNPLVRALGDLSGDLHQMTTRSVVDAFENANKAQTPSDRFVTSMETADALRTMSSKITTVQVLGRSVVKNIEALTTRMS